MGYKEDQDYLAETYRPQITSQGRPPPPPLPPRQSTATHNPYFPSPPPYTEVVPNYHSQPLTHSWSAQDPRSSSTQSLVPEEHAKDDYRTLLLVYIHGFMGNETSFQSFPAHVHNLVTVKLADSHHVHTKIYPRYKSRKAIDHARDDFSKWLSPHESPQTDVILIGHSMGGILSAEVALLESPAVQNDWKFLRHRIVGTINFDTPFLGMHPGVVVSGIGSLFRPAPETPGGSAMVAESQDLRPMPASDDGIPAAGALSPQQQEMEIPPSSSSTTLIPTESYTSSTAALSPFTSPISDPNYNPPFPNDVRMATRSGWGNALHFINKHSDGLARATRSYVTSYFEFGGCLADYNGLKNRYSRLRSLEEADSRRRDGLRRTRFVNYYTASTGRPKKPKLPPRIQQPETTAELSNDAQREESPTEPGMQRLTLSESNTSFPEACPKVSLETSKDSDLRSSADGKKKELLSASTCDSTSDVDTKSESSYTMNVVDAAPMSDSEDLGPRAEGDDVAAEINELHEQDPDLRRIASNPSSGTVSAQGLGTSTSTPKDLSETLSLPPIPAEPQEPTLFDASSYPEKDARKLAEKEHARQVKGFERAVKDREKAIKDRRKLLEKREKTLKQAREKQLKREEKEIAKAKKKDLQQEAKASRRSKDESLRASSEGAEPQETDGAADEEAKGGKSKRDKKFCMLPPKINGEVDPCWVRVYMTGVDEVGAHCGLFFVGEQYEWLVGNVGERIRGWVDHR